MTSTTNHDYTDRILFILKQKKVASLYFFKDSIRALKWDDKGEEKLQACLDEMVSSGKIFVHTTLNRGQPANVYYLNTERNRYLSTQLSSVGNRTGNDVSNISVANDDDHKACNNDDSNNSDDSDSDVDDGSDNQNEQAMSENATTLQQQIEGQEYIIDPEFRDLFPQKTREQYEELKETICAAGEFRDPLVVWDEMNILADGHGRDQIYTEL